MKKVLAVLALVLMVSIFMVMDTQASSDSFDTGDVLYTAPYSQDFYTDIAPNVQLIDPGSIKVNISWSNPILTFEKKTVSNNGQDIRYYALKNPQTVVFNITNNSSSGTSFSGTIYVTPSYTRTNARETMSSNIRVLMTEQTIVHTIPMGGSDNSILLEFQNVEDQFFGQIPINQLLSGGASGSQIVDIMTTTVKFKISTSK